MLLATVTANSNTSVAVSASTTGGKSYKHNFQDTLAACRCLFDFDPQGHTAYKCKVQGDTEQKGDYSRTGTKVKSCTQPHTHLLTTLAALP